MATGQPCFIHRPDENTYETGCMHAGARACIVGSFLSFFPSFLSFCKTRFQAGSADRR